MPNTSYPNSPTLPQYLIDLKNPSSLDLERLAVLLQDGRRFWFGTVSHPITFKGQKIELCFKDTSQTIIKRPSKSPKKPCRYDVFYFLKPKQGRPGIEFDKGGQGSLYLCDQNFRFEDQDLTLKKLEQDKLRLVKYFKSLPYDLEERLNVKKVSENEYMQGHKVDTFAPGYGLHMKEPVHTPIGSFLIMDKVNAFCLYNFLLYGEGRHMTFQMRLWVGIQSSLAYNKCALAEVLMRDIKLENILIHPYNQTITPCDYGLARDLYGEDKDLAGTPRFVARELLSSTSNAHCSLATDMYSFGWVLFLLFGGKDKIYKYEDRTIEEWKKILPKLDSRNKFKSLFSNIPKPLGVEKSDLKIIKKMIKAMLSKKPEKRPRFFTCYEKLLTLYQKYYKLPNSDRVREREGVYFHPSFASKTIPSTIGINIEKLTSMDMQVLAYLLKGNTCYWNSMNFYSIVYSDKKEKEVFLKDNQNIIKRPSKYSQRDRFDAFYTSGEFYHKKKSSVFYVSDRVFYFEKNGRCMVKLLAENKLRLVHSILDKKKAHNAYTQASKIDPRYSLHVKEPCNTALSSFMSMRWPEKACILQRFLNTDEGDYSLPIEKRLQIAASIIENVIACQKARVLYRNINPTSILIDENKGRAWFYDFTQATDSTNPDTKNPWTIEYSAIELIVNKSGTLRSSDQTEMYSLGRVLFLLFRGDRESFILDDTIPLEKIVSHIQNINYDSLFDNLPTLEDWGKAAIRQMLKRMMSVHPEERPTADVCLNTLNEVLSRHVAEPMDSMAQRPLASTMRIRGEEKKPNPLEMVPIGSTKSIKTFTQNFFKQAKKTISNAPIFSSKLMGH